MKIKKLNSYIIYENKDMNNIKDLVENYQNNISKDLSYANLRCADLRYANLSGADLSGADLRCADLSYANLSGANLRCADLSGADLRCANLSGADLSGADLSGADLRCADLSYANLSGANLRCVDLSGADLRCANLSGAEHIYSFQCGDKNRISYVYFHKEVKFLIDCFNGNLEQAVKKIKKDYGENSFYENLVNIYSEMMLKEIKEIDNE